MKILITSDNHLGFKETDPIRADDSFNTFDEIIRLAVQEKADFILQGGDLFHENKPTRNTYNKTMLILKKHCIGDKKTELTSNIPLNFSNEHINISMPILSIHGNHDDPTGYNSLSPLDVLNSGGLINYFGRVADVDNIVLNPILIQGDVKVAIYGLGYVKDRRVYQTFKKEAVRYIRPEGEDWFYILMLHQNRVPREGEYLPEDLISPMFDLVIYGHEHESIKVRHKNFDVIQVGSSIRTSLCEGESHDKYAYILDLVGNASSIRRIVLKSVRPLIMDTMKVVMGDTETQVTSKIEELLQSINYNGMLPLLRLRIELNGNPDFNKHRLFCFLEDKIANPSDSLRILRKNCTEDKVVHKIIHKTDIEDIYLKILDSANLRTLLNTKVVESLRDFVHKDIKEAFCKMVRDMVDGLVNISNMNESAGTNIDDVIKYARLKMMKSDKEVQGEEENESFIPTFDTYDHKNTKDDLTFTLSGSMSSPKLKSRKNSLDKNKEEVQEINTKRIKIESQTFNESVTSKVNKTCEDDSIDELLNF